MDLFEFIDYTHKLQKRHENPEDDYKKPFDCVNLIYLPEEVIVKNVGEYSKGTLFCRDSMDTPYSKCRISSQSITIEKDIIKIKCARGKTIELKLIN